MQRFHFWLQKKTFKWRHYFDAIFSILKTNAIFKILRQNWAVNTNILNKYWFLKMLLFTWLWTYLDLGRHWLRGGGGTPPCRIFAIAQRLTEDRRETRSTFLDINFTPSVNFLSDFLEFCLVLANLVTSLHASFGQKEAQRQTPA